MDGRGRSSGFSLLEMLLVLFVIVLLTSLVTLNVNSGADSRTAESALRSLRATAAYALDEAQFSGRDFGLLLLVGEGMDGGLLLSWRERLPQGWRSPQRSGDLFEDTNLPEAATLILDDVLVQPLEFALLTDRPGTAPQWLFLASGETQAGELLWRDGDSGALVGSLRWDALGRFELQLGSEDGLDAARR